MNDCCRGDESITIGSRIWNVKRRTLLPNCEINRQHAIGESREDMLLHPCTKHRTLLMVTPLH